MAKRQSKTNRPKTGAKRLNRKYNAFLKAVDDVRNNKGESE